MPSATVAASPAVNSAWMIRLRRTVPLLPYMSIAASRLTFTPAWSHAEHTPGYAIWRSWAYLGLSFGKHDKRAEEA